ncbi:hypothetical protein NPIL_539051 [Nephila pilipes]|uniref:HTH psq-type domain-containing protein n=1 Tax=Nephila pilipes TaxID=299642 RepID=A0A8X6TSI2_NEPPI|nr:hypothetical protein NPIL_539051 [Nephila pilipes]
MLTPERRRPRVRDYGYTATIHQLKNGASGSSLAREYGVGKATILDIKKNRDGHAAVSDLASDLLYVEGPGPYKGSRLPTDESHDKIRPGPSNWVEERGVKTTWASLL